MHRRRFLALSSLWLTACGRPSVAFRNTDLTGATFGRKLVLSDHHGRRRSLDDFRGQVIVLFFGYTACPDVCPTTLVKLAEAMQAWGGDAARVQVLFVTLDPERDSADRLRQFVPWFHPSFLGLRGNARETKAVIEEFRLFASRKQVDSELGYVLDHSSGLYVFDPAGRLRLFARDSGAVVDLVEDVRLLLAGN